MGDQSLREQAEAILRGRDIELGELSPEHAKRLLHELQIYQIELDLQNEELRQAQHEVEATRDRYMDLYDFAPVGYVTLDTHGTIQEINLTGASMLGLERSHLLGKRLVRFVLVENRDRLYLHLKALRDGGEAQDCEIRMQHASGKHFHARLHSIADDNGQIRSSITDISDHKRLEQERLELALERERALILAQFIEDALHEFRTPLSSIQMELSVLKMVLSESAHQKSLRFIDGQLDTMSTLLNRLAIMIRLDSGDPLKFKRADLNQIVSTLYTAKQAALERKHLQTGLHLHPTLPHVTCDPEKLSLALENILDNAIRHTPDGGSIALHTRRNDQHVSVQIRDSGDGIDPDDVLHIFERFWRKDQAHTTSGLGLGLTIAQRIVEGHRGQIDVESTPGAGSTFTITLPLT